MEVKERTEVIEQFLPDIDECGTGRKKDNLCLRFCRKKFKCIIILMLTLTVMFETTTLILKKVDENLIETILMTTLNITTSMFRSALSSNTTKVAD